MITLSSQQHEAFHFFFEWFNDRAETREPKVFRLFGYAGTGKTSIAQALVNVLREKSNLRSWKYGAFTGKAASVMEAKGCRPASTIHGMIYKPLGEDEKGEMKFSFTSSRVRGLQLAVIDECSMVGENMGKDLMSLGCKVLVLGDPAQLPPVGEGGYFTNGVPDVLLTQIHRQAESSGILQMATAVRSGSTYNSVKGYSDAVIGRSATMDEVDSHDIVLCGTNRRRQALNHAIRQHRGKVGLVDKGDRVVCIRNNHTLGVMNGETGEVLDATELSPGEWHLTVQWDGAGGRVTSAFSPEAPFKGQKVSEWGRNQLSLDYGYAITVHKSQGSQWDRVLLVDESYAFRDSAKQWLYTGITRAAKHLTIVR